MMWANPWRSMRRALLLAAVLVVVGGGGTLANPDVWVNVLATYRFENGKVTGITYEWRFDEYFSSRTIGTFDANSNGTFEPEEIERLRVEAFAPLAKYDFHVHVWVDGKKRGAVMPKNFMAAIKDNRLVYQFTVPFEPWADPRTEEIVASLHDKDIVIDFAFVEKDFLLVEGGFDLDCKFRVARGRGAQSGHTQPVTLKCGGST